MTTRKNGCSYFYYIILFFFLVSLPDRLASIPPSQPESCGCEKFFLTARDFFSDICQVGSWESTCLLYAATGTVGKEDSMLNGPADKLFLPLFFFDIFSYLLPFLVDQIYLNAFWWTKLIFTFIGLPN